MLKVDGKMFCQSLAIARYCSKLAKLPVLNNEEALASDMIMDTCTEVFEKAVPAAFAARNAIPEDRKLIKIDQNRNPFRCKNFVLSQKNEIKYSMTQQRVILSVSDTISFQK